MFDSQFKAADSIAVLSELKHCKVAEWNSPHVLGYTGL